MLHTVGFKNTVKATHANRLRHSVQGQYNSAEERSSHTLAARLIASPIAEDGSESFSRVGGLVTPGSLWADLSEIHRSLAHVQQVRSCFLLQYLNIEVGAGGSFRY